MPGRFVGMAHTCTSVRLQIRGGGSPIVRGKCNMTKTRSFGVGAREGHDASLYYGRKMSAAHRVQLSQRSVNELRSANMIYQADARDMHHLPDNSVALAFTSPP